MSKLQGVKNALTWLHMVRLTQRSTIEVGPRGVYFGTCAAVRAMLAHHVLQRLQYLRIVPHKVGRLVSTSQWKKTTATGNFQKLRTCPEIGFSFDIKKIRVRRWV